MAKCPPIKGILFVWVLMIIMLPVMLHAQFGTSTIGIEGSFYSKLKGFIAEKYPITLEMQHLKSEESDNQVIGVYYYDKIRTPITLRGQLEENGIIQLEESDPQTSRVTGIFKGKFTGKGVFEGVWENPGNKKTMPVKLHEALDDCVQAEFHYHAKKNCDRRMIRGGFDEEEEESSEIDTSAPCSFMAVSMPRIITAKPVIADQINHFLFRQLIGDQDETTAPKTAEEYVNRIDQLQEEDFIEEMTYFEITLNDKNLLSIRMVGNSFSGGAHGMSWDKYFNFDLSSGRLLTLDDIFRTGSEGELLRVAKTHFIEENGDLSEWSFGDNGFYLNKEFSLLMEGIVFTWNAYEIGAYAQGAPTVLIPYSEIRQLLKTDSPIHSIIK